MTESSPPPKAYTPTLLSRSDTSTSNSSLPTLPGAEAISFLDTSEKQRDIEKCEIIKPLEKQMKPLSSFQFVGWMIVNTLATIGIVFTNKAIFSDPTLRQNQSTFAAFHFTVTGATLYAASRSSVGMFVPKRARFVQMMPLAVAMCLNVILPNLSLAFSSIAFYQIVRVLLTPLVAVINFVFYGTSIPRRAVYTIVPICVGVAMVSYYDTRSAKEHRTKPAIPTTSLAGVCFAFAGVVASSMYTVWIGTYHKKFNMNSMQLLFNQAPMSAFLLLFVIKFTDRPPHWDKVPQNRWVMVMLASLFLFKRKSGIMASLINISQFFIVAGAGPVSSTVVGHLKTCSIVALGWAASGKKANDKGVVGVMLAVSGIIAYSIIMYQHKQSLQLKARTTRPDTEER